MHDYKNIISLVVEIVRFYKERATLYRKHGNAHLYKKIKKICESVKIRN